MVNILGFGSIIAKPWAWPKQKLKINKTTSRRGYFTISDSKLTTDKHNTILLRFEIFTAHNSKFQFSAENKIPGFSNSMASHTHLDDVNNSSNFSNSFYIFLVVFVVSLILSLFVKLRTMNSEAIFLELTMPGVQVFLFIFF